MPKKKGRKKRSHQTIGRHSKGKGGRGEREARDQCKLYWYADDCVRSRQVSGAYAADLLYALHSAHVEVKRHKRHALFRFFEQADDDRNAAEFPVVMLREDRTTDWVFCLRMEDTERFVFAYLENRKDSGAPPLDVSAGCLARDEG